MSALAAVVAERLLAELANDGITEATLALAAHVSGGLSPEKMELLSALNNAVREARTEDGLGQASALRLREALAAVRA